MKSIKSIKQKLMLLGLAGATFLSAPSVMADPFDDKKDESIENTEKKDETSPFGDANANASNETAANENAKPAKKESFLSSKKGTIILLGGGIVLYVVMKVVEKKKKDKEE